MDDTHVTVNNAFEFIELVHRLKHVTRKGWEHFDVAKPERIADHMYAMAMMTFLLVDDDDDIVVDIKEKETPENARQQHKVEAGEVDGGGRERGVKQENDEQTIKKVKESEETAAESVENAKDAPEIDDSGGGGGGATTNCSKCAAQSERRKRLDRLKCMQLALVHDLAESIVGDITPRDNVTDAEKYRLEESAMRSIRDLVDGRPHDDTRSSNESASPSVGQRLYDLWREYETRRTPESRFVKDLDRFDLLMTAYHYERRDATPGKLEEFYASTSGKFEHPFVRRLVDELVRRRRRERAPIESTADDGRT